MVAPTGPEEAAAVRQSMVFFLGPNYDAMIRCITLGEPAKYPPVESGVYYAEKLARLRTAAA